MHEVHRQLDAAGAADPCEVGGMGFGALHTAHVASTSALAVVHKLHFHCVTRGLTPPQHMHLWLVSGLPVAHRPHTHSAPSCARLAAATGGVATGATETPREPMPGGSARGGTRPPPCELAPASTLPCGG